MTTDPEGLIGELKSKYKFSEEAIRLCRGAKFRCKYCRCDVLDLFDDWRTSHFDHILPKSRYPQLEYAESNKVLACATCNYLKGTWDPNQIEGSPQIVGSGVTELFEWQRRQLLARAIRHVREVRAKEQSEFAHYRQILRKLGPMAIPASPSTLS